MTKQRTRPIRWLHLSDLHLGCPGQAMWWGVESDFARSVREMTAKLGPPDLVLLTGDLAYSGQPAQYKQVDQFLKALLQSLRETGGEDVDPILLAVPGNHDVAWQTGTDVYQFNILDQYTEEDAVALRSEFWSPTKPTARYFDPLLGAYKKWFNRRIRKPLPKRAANVNFSHFPCDFRADLEIPGAFPLTVVGLNSTWIQYQAGDYERKLEIPREQFHCALSKKAGTSPLAALPGDRHAILLQHHPPSWLTPASKRVFHEEIYRPDNFAVCLFGHLHESRAEAQAYDGGAFRYYFQARSLFGLEHYGRKHQQRESFGYAWGSLSPDGEVRVWPLERFTQGGEPTFGPDRSQTPDGDGGVLIGHVEYHGPTTTKASPAVDWTPYLRSLIERIGFIDIAGIGVGGGGEQTAGRYRIESLYTTLRTRAPIDRSVVGSDTYELGIASHHGRLAAEGPVPLASILAGRSRLLIEGEPGGGKTTFLHVVGAMLARDQIGEPCAYGSSWCEHFLGLDEDWDTCVPVFLPLAKLAERLRGADADRPRDRERIIDLIEDQYSSAEVDRESWRDAIENGEAVLLLDALDEVTDPRIREAVFDVFRDAACQWSDCPIIVTSRPFMTKEVRDLGFEHVSIEPFELPEIEAFTRLWARALYGIDPEQPLVGKAEEDRAALVNAICERPYIRRMATNPVMLTCLCVVHWNQGKHLPEGRSRVYEAVLRWLRNAKAPLREKAGFADAFAEAAFQHLAMRMMGPEEGESKRVVIDIEDAAMELHELAARYMLDLPAKDRRDRVRTWLRFECQGSGIIEEVGQNQVRFWHQTFQEYLAAVELNGFDENERDEPEGDPSWWPVIRRRLDDPQWRETVEMFPACLHEHGTRRVDKLLRWVLAERGAAADLADEARLVGIMGRLLAPLEVYAYPPPRDVYEAYEVARHRILAMFELEGAAQFPVEKRIAAAGALGRGGDPRLDPAANEPLPIGDSSSASTPRLGKYPVTVQDYQQFANDARGYEHERFWAEGWAEKTKAGWTAPASWEAQLTKPNRPVVGVSWYEASAYCRWLSEVRGLDVRLPTESQWVAAARRPDGEYPWGPEPPNEDRANYGEPGGEPTPVGVYPLGAGPYGHLDLAGNVWEWCADEVSGKADENVRALRGGSYWHGAESLRVGTRLRGPAGSRSGGIGFRVLVSPASS